MLGVANVTSRDSPEGRSDLTAARRVAVAPESAACTFVLVFGGGRWIRTSDPAS